MGSSCSIAQSLGSLRIPEALSVLTRFDSITQLMAERDLDRARHVVLVPDLMTYWLSGQLGTELTNASTTGLLRTVRSRPHSDRNVLNARLLSFAPPLPAR